MTVPMAIRMTKSKPATSPPVFTLAGSVGEILCMQLRGSLQRVSVGGGGGLEAGVASSIFPPKTIHKVTHSSSVLCVQ